MPHCATNVAACVVSNAALSLMINVSLSSHSSSLPLLASLALNVAQTFAVHVVEKTSYKKRF